MAAPKTRGTSITRTVRPAHSTNSSGTRRPTGSRSTMPAGEFAGNRMLDAKYLSDQFTHAIGYAPYVQTGTGEQQRRWREAYEAVAIAPAQRQLVTGFKREMKVLVVSGIWCGDCIVQCPMIQ